MTFKLFRRGSARCIGLLSAFVTILLCLYYISMGQPTSMPSTKDTPLAAGLMQNFNNNNKNGNSNNNNYGSMRLNNYNNNDKVKLNSIEEIQNNFIDNESDKSKYFKETINEPLLRVEESSTKLHATSKASNYRPKHKQVTNDEWTDKCYVLNERATNITAAEEYANFDFQVI